MTDEKEYIERIEDLLDKKPYIESDLESILEVEKEKNIWHFEDINVDSGRFGEIVSSGVVTSKESGYHVPEELLLEAYLEGELEQSNKEPSYYRAILNSLPSRTKPQYLILLLTIVGVGGYLRTIHAGRPPFWIDESISLSAAMGFLEFGEFVLHGSLNRYDRAPLSTLFIAASISILGVSEFAARLPSMIFGILTILLVYVLGTKTNSKPVGIISAFLYAFSFFTVAWSRQARMYTPLVFFFVLSTIFWWYTIRTNRQKERGIYLLLCLGSIFLMSKIHSSWIIILPMLTFASALIVRPTHRLYVRARWFLFIATGIFILTIITTQNPIFPNQLYALFGIDATKVEFLGEIPTFFTTHYPLMSLFAVLGTVSSISSKKSRRSIIIVGFWFSLFVTSYFLLAIHPFFWPRYLLFILPFFFILSSAGIHDIANYFSDTQMRIKYIEDYQGEFEIESVILAVLLVAAVVLLPGFVVTTDGLSNIHEPQPDYRQAVETMERNGYTESDVVVSTRPNLLYVYGVDVDYVVSPAGSGDTDYYTNATTLTQRNQVVQIKEQNESGWIVINNYRNVPGEEWIEDNLILVDKIEADYRFDRVDYQLKSAPENGEETVYIYRWK